MATYASLRAVLDHYRSGDWQADVALVTGDLVHDDSAAAYGHFADLLGDLHLPVYCLPGNHDVRDLMQRALSAPAFHYCEPLAAGRWHIVSIDSCVTGSAGGHVSAVGLDNREELLQRLAVSGKVRLVVFGHVHQPYDAVHDSMRIIGTPSTCRQFKQRSTLFAVDDNPPAYRRIELLDDGNINNELVWLTEW